MNKKMERKVRDEPENETIIFVTDHEGREHALPALDGWRVMEVIRDWGLSLKPECGGAGVCATCHVFIDDAWLDRLEPPSDDELGTLDETPAAENRSRLCCQILVSPGINGIRLQLAPGSEAA